ncbi:stressosome-associated protein Prli42 [Rossellomorea sp. SC111]|nr:stressosome-associated protein Prli42 [Rossellomorea sp. SC111]MCR8847062.1 stressosome-associated protein Prli42 [Rossellomorea sp. SC111]
MMGNKKMQKIIVFVMLFAMIASTIMAGLSFLL